MIPAGYIFDPDNICPHCGGSGSEKEQTDTGFILSNCYWCCGTGKKTIVLFEKEEGADAANT